MRIKILAGARARVNLLCGTTALLASTVLTPCWAASLPNCSDLAAQIFTNPDVVAATSVLVPASGADLAYCNVQLQYSHLAGPAAGYAPGQSQLIQIGIGLPLSAADGGSGGVQGAWTGRIEDLGRGGTAGSVGSTTAATDLGDVGSSTDTGHSATTVGGSGSNFPLNGIVGTFPGGTFTAALNPPNDNSFNWGIYADFAYRSIHAKSVMSKFVTQLYYGRAQDYSYWVGCSEGGREAMSEAMRYPNDHNGLLIGDPVMMYDRLQPMQFWGRSSRTMTSAQKSRLPNRRRCQTRQMPIARTISAACRTALSRSRAPACSAPISTYAGNLARISTGYPTRRIASRLQRPRT